MVEGMWEVLSDDTCASYHVRIPVPHVLRAGGDDHESRESLNQYRQ